MNIIKQTYLKLGLNYFCTLLYKVVWWRNWLIVSGEGFELYFGDYKSVTSQTLLYYILVSVVTEWTLYSLHCSFYINRLLKLNTICIIPFKRILFSFSSHAVIRTTLLYEQDLYKKWWDQIQGEIYIENIGTNN